MMRPVRRKPRTSQSAQPEIETIDDVEHLRGLLEQNERLLRTPSLFATSSKSPSAGDDLAQKLQSKNQRIRARLQALEDQELDRLANGVDRTKLDDSPVQEVDQEDAMNGNHVTSPSRATPSAKHDLERRMDERFARQAAEGPRKLSMVTAQESHAIQEKEAREHPPAQVPRFEDYTAAKGAEDELDTIAKMARMRAYLGHGLGGIDDDWGGFSDEDDDDDDLEDFEQDVASQSGSEAMAMSMDLSEVIKVDVAKTEAVKGGIGAA